MPSSVLSQFCIIVYRMKLQYTRPPPSAPAVETPTSPGDTERWRPSPWSPSKWVRLAHFFGGFSYWRKSTNDRVEMRRLSPWSQFKGVRHDMSIFGGFLYGIKPINDRAEWWRLSPWSQSKWVRHAHSGRIFSLEKID